jgi:hypothetical protein
MLCMVFMIVVLWLQACRDAVTKSFGHRGAVNINLQRHTPKGTSVHKKHKLHDST